MSSKFGDLIDIKEVVVLVFFTEWHEDCKEVHVNCRDLQANFGDNIRVIKIDVDKNAELAEALRVITMPTVMIYKDGEQLYKLDGGQITNKQLIEIISLKL